MTVNITAELHQILYVSLNKNVYILFLIYKYNAPLNKSYFFFFTCSLLIVLATLYIRLVSVV